MMKRVVTGASGHVGANLVRALLHQGHSVHALVHVDTAALAGLDVQTLRGDVCDLSTLRCAFQGADVVYHLAGQISISQDSGGMLGQVNVEGTRNVVRACLDCGVRRLIHFSSIHAVTATPPEVPVTESTPLVEDGTEHPSYDQSKALGERIVAEAVRQGLDAIVLAPTAVVGPHDYRPSYFGQVLLSLARNRMPLLVSGGFDWVDVRDVVEATIRAEETAPSGSKYLLSGHWLSLMDVARLAGDVTGSPVSCAAVPLPLARACAPLAEAFCRLTDRTPLFTRYSIEALCQHRLVSHQKATTELAYQPRSFEETLADTYRWFRENGYLPSNAVGGVGQL